MLFNNGLFPIILIIIYILFFTFNSMLEIDEANMKFNDGKDLNNVLHIGIMDRNKKIILVKFINMKMDIWKL